MTSPVLSQQQAPLTEQEVATVQRLLADPSYFPREFKQWITDHASDSVDIAKGQVHGLINSNGQLIFTDASWDQLGAVLVGVILPFAASVPPSANWLRCDGSYYLESAYPKLFDLIGHAHDPIVSTGQFSVPDLRGRAVYGHDENVGTGYMPFGGRDGAAPGGRGVSHHHNVPDHSHGMNHQHGLDYAAAYGAGGDVAVQGGGTDTLTGGSTFSQTGGSGTLQTTGAPPLDGPAWYALNYIIATGNLPD